MRSLALILLVAIAWCGDAPAPAKDDSKLPVEAKTIVEKHDKAVAEAKALYDKACAKADADASKELNKVLAVVVKHGDFDGGVAIKAKLDGYTPKIDVLGNVITTNKLQILVVKYGVEGHWFDATKFIQAKVKDGSLHFTNDEDGCAGLPDPAPGATKSFVITYTLHGEQKVETFSKHAVIDLAE